MAYSEHDLSNLVVRLHVSIRFDDCVKGKGLGDFRFEFSVVDAFVDVALGSRQSLRIGHGGLRQPVATNSQRLLESWYERKWRFSHSQPPISDDHRPERGCLRELAEQRTSDRIENDARTRPTGDVLERDTLSLLRPSRPHDPRRVQAVRLVWPLCGSLRWKRLPRLSQSELQRHQRCWKPPL